MRRLLVLCYFYPPLAGGGVHRVLGFSRHLPAHGWDVTVVCAGEQDYWVRDASLVELVPPATEVIRVTGGSALATWMRVRGGGDRGERAGQRSGPLFAGLRSLSDWWLLPDSYAGWSRRAAAAAGHRIARGGVDAVLTTSPPDSVHLAGLTLRRRFPLPWVADFRDPWIGLRFREPPTAWHRARHEAMERSVLANADLVLAASATHTDDLARGAGGATPPRRLEHLPNGFEPATEDREAGASGGSADHFVLAFTGTIAQMPDAEVFLEALHDLLARRPEARRRLRAKLAGPFESGLADRATTLGLTGIVEFTGPQPHAATRALQRRADLLVLWKPRGAGYRTMVPGKLYEYLDAGRPVVAMLDPADEAAVLVARAGGEVVPPAQRAPLAAAIERHYLAWKEGARPAPARPDWLGEHERSRLAGKLAQQLDRLTAAAGGGRP